jgi:hypothetical protein
LIKNNVVFGVFEIERKVNFSSHWATQIITGFKSEKRKKKQNNFFADKTFNKSNIWK